METKKEKIVSAVATMGIVLMLFGATYAYFVSDIDTGKITDVEIRANTVDVFTSETGETINISLDQDNFASGKGNRVGSTFAKVTLSANNKTNTATEHYFLYLNIEANSFDYTQDDNTAEILLQVTRSNGDEVTKLTNLEYKTVVDGLGETIKGFDITTELGLYSLVETEISTEDIIEETWYVSIVFVNLDANQNKNVGKSMKASLIITKEAKTSVALANYVKAQYTGIQGENSIYYHNGTIVGEDGTVLDANDYSYRYAGASDSTNNFVCFGSNAIPCPDDNLYRIIGAFGDRVRLIKYDYTSSELLGTDTSSYYSVYSDWHTNEISKGSLNKSLIGRYYWNTSSNSDWSYSDLNKTHLNINYLTNIGNEWSNMIDVTEWKSGVISSVSVVPSVLYTNEITSEAMSTSEAKISLVYVSDYGFAASPSAWTTKLSGYGSVTNVNWMYMGLTEWTISRASDGIAYAIWGSVSNYCFDNFNFIGGSHTAVRPVFHLNADVTYVSGSGTKSEPIRIS